MMIKSDIHSVFDICFNAIADDLVLKLNRNFPNHRFYKTNECKMEDIISLMIDDEKFYFNLSNYIDESVEHGEKIAFSNLQREINNFINQLHT